MTLKLSRARTSRSRSRHGAAYADRLVPQPCLHDVLTPPDVPRVDEGGRAGRRATQAASDLVEIRGAVAAPLGQKNQSIRPVEGVVVGIDHLHASIHRLCKVRPRLRIVADDAGPLFEQPARQLDRWGLAYVVGLGLERE